MLIKYRDSKKIYNFSDAENKSENNIFTVIVGKNGTGKSRLMKSVIIEFIGEEKNKKGKITVGGLSKHKPKKSIIAGALDNIDVTHAPQNIIAVSTSPFDKFPLESNGSTFNEYTYLGLRNLKSTDLSMAYMANIYTSLIKSVAKDKGRATKIFKVLEYLGYSPKISAKFYLELPTSRVKEVLNSHNLVASFNDHFTSHSELYRHRLRRLHDDEELRNLQVERILEIYKKIGGSIPGRKFEVLLEGDQIHFSADGANEEDYFFLADLELVRLQGVTLEKNDGKSLKIREASSGEQSVVMSILGITSQISNDSLICIDEPEVCLHPEWQERYIELLMSTFKDFKGCHFLIATHSPLIVSKLGDKGCFLMKMDDGKAIPASMVNNKSADYQLANTFGAPGYKNEYLTRELVSALTVFGKTGKVDDGTKSKLKFLLSLKNTLSESDPVKKLMEIAEEALEESI